MKTKENTKTKTSSLLSIKIDKQWDVVDFIRCLKAIKYMYGFYSTLLKIPLMLKEESKIKFDPRHKKPSFLFFANMFQTNISSFEEDELFNPFTLGTTRMEQGLFSNLDADFQLRRIQYSSPGSIDFIGLGKVFESMKELVFHYFPNEEKKADIQLKKLEIMEKEIALLKELGISELQIKAIIFKRDLALESLLDLVKSKQMRAMDITEN